GRRQRMGIARGRAPGARLGVGEEPVSALDVSVQAQILNLLIDLQVRFGLSYLFIAHDLSVVRYLSDRVAVMYLGKIVETGEAEDVFRHPRHPYTEALLSALPETDPTAAEDRIVLHGDVPSPADPPPGCPFHPRCRYAEDRCKADPPELVEISPGHATACLRSRELELQGKPFAAGP
ncbi:MAG: ABC transporter ATP-binding protein, partial [Spirochaetaceae bacterium]|nr:ABC transporter ATP-binding protein [Spirochaetaceae bacterium]